MNLSKTKTKKTILYLFFLLIISIFISLNVSAQTVTYYCASDKTFTEDLDDKDVATCQSAGEIFTGSLCCSEDDDPNEHYNDFAVNAEDANNSIYLSWAIFARYCCPEILKLCPVFWTNFSAKFANQS